MPLRASHAILFLFAPYGAHGLIECVWSSCREAKQAAAESTQTAEACTNAIVAQEAENERLRRMARFQQATVRNTLGGGGGVTGHWVFA